MADTIECLCTSFITEVIFIWMIDHLLCNELEKVRSGVKELIFFSPNAKSLEKKIKWFRNKILLVISSKNKKRKIKNRRLQNI